MNRCSFSEQLPHFINEELFEAAQREVEEHVESCSACQLELEQLTSDEGIAVGSSMLLASRKNGSSIQRIDSRFADRLLHEGPKVNPEIDPEADVFRELPARTPSQIGDYEIVRELGRGGMGVVYEAEQCSLRRRVALKVLPLYSHFSNEFRLRFQREAHAAARMHHKNIVPVFEVGNEDGYFFYAMQLIQGCSLDQVIDQLRDVRSGSRFKKFAARSEQPVPGMVTAAKPFQTNGEALSGHLSHSNSNAGHRKYCQSIAKIAYQVAEALAYAHARGVIHRDIKPSNLILDEEGVVWVTDFGLAKTNDEGMTQTGDFLGTLRYMSPERFSGVCDGQTDVYALGITLYELLVLRPAFAQSDRLQLMDAIRQVDPPGPRTLDRRIPTDLETIVLKACDKEPQARYASAAELADDLGRFLNDEPILARRTSLPERLARWSRKNKGLVFSLLGAALVGAAWITGSMFGADNQAGTSPSISLPAAAPKTPPTERELQVATELLNRGATFYIDVGPGAASDIEFIKIRSVDQWLQAGVPIDAIDLTGAEQLENSLLLLQELPKLRELWLREALLTGSILDLIVRIASLEQVELSGTDLDDSDLDWFLRLPELEELNVGGTQVTLEGIKRFMQDRPKTAVIWHNRQ